MTVASRSLDSRARGSTSRRASNDGVETVRFSLFTFQSARALRPRGAARLRYSRESRVVERRERRTTTRVIVDVTHDETPSSTRVNGPPYRRHGVRGVPSATVRHGARGDQIPARHPRRDERKRLDVLHALFHIFTLERARSLADISRHPSVSSPRPSRRLPRERDQFIR